jgi:hypothetical protein
VFFAFFLKNWATAKTEYVSHCLRTTTLLLWLITQLATRFFFQCVARDQAIRSALVFQKRHPKNQQQARFWRCMRAIAAQWRVR